MQIFSFFTVILIKRFLWQKRMAQSYINVLTAVTLSRAGWDAALNAANGTAWKNASLILQPFLLPAGAAL